ncbi:MULTISPECIES: MaoC family dehydratase [Halobacteriales]|jgi:acyl dehydratase|uniref:MaoC family dehydratase n=1 Tax=Halobacteriales TaxID=2235 RepID=UPI001FF26183|nr:MULTISPECIES: MaoC family dehydratase [Haloarculaceae]
MYNRYYEDFVVGETHKTDDVEVTKQEILEFGQKYDPLPFHIDEETAAETPFNGVIASGLQTFALSQKQVVDSFFRESHLLGSVGFDEAEFPNPVRPGDTLSTTLEILEKRPSKSNPSRGLVTIMRKVVNQHDSVVLRVTNNVLVERQ